MKTKSQEKSRAQATRAKSHRAKGKEQRAKELSPEQEPPVSRDEPEQSKRRAKSQVISQDFNREPEPKDQRLKKYYIKSC
jgi:hypothetical protein